MTEKISISYYLQAAAGAEGYVDIYTVPGARTLKNRVTLIFFPIGDYSELEVALYSGSMKVLPKSGTYRGDGLLIDDDSEAQWSAGSTVRLYYKNNNSTETREAQIIIRGELV